MSLFAELKRRNVIRVAIAYVVLGWVVLQGADFLLDLVAAPEWVIRVFAIAGLVGLPFALFFAWAFELTPEGIKRERDIDRSRSMTSRTGRKLDIVIIALLTLGIVILLVDRWYAPAGRATDSRQEANQETLPTDDADAGPTDEPSVAVLPFVNLSDDKDYFADGLSEELMNLLAKNPDLQVAGRTSSFAFKGRNEDLRQIGEALGVNHVLEGSVRRSGDTLRITAQLINVGNGFHIWSETYDRQLADIFAIQDDVASAIARALKVRLTAPGDVPPVDPHAYALYVEALPYIARNDSPEVLDTVLTLLNQAIALDSSFAKAYEAKALSYWMVSGEAVDAATAARLIHEASTRALELDPSLVLARYYKEVSNPGASWWLTEYEAVTKALEEAPDEFNVLRAWCHDLIYVGYLRRAISCSRRMIDLEPLSNLGYYRLGMAESVAGNRVEALNSFLQADEMSPASFYDWDIMLVHLMAGDIEEAIRVAEEDPRPVWGWSAADIRRVTAWRTAGDFDAIKSWVKEAGESAPSPLAGYSPLYWYLFAGLLDDYWSEIEEIGEPNRYSWTDAEWLVIYGMAQPQTGFRSHPSFLEYARLSGLIDVWERYGPPDYCEKLDGDWVCH